VAQTWQINWSDPALKEYRKLDKQFQKEIRDYLVERIIVAENPRSFGKPLSGSLSGLWRYRIGSYRVVCRIEDGALTVLILRVAHRSKVYRNT
jgi:mRNA interferase RelE/StbE